MPSTKFRAKPVEVDAIEFDEHDWQTLNSWLAAELGEERFYFLISGRNITLHIETQEGDRDCQPGYWIVKGTQGEFYPVSPEAFAAKYEYPR